MGDSLYRIETRSASPPDSVGGQEQRYLLIVDGDRSRRHHLPARGTLLVGRSDDADIPVADVSVSRRHARLAVSIDNVTINDCGSHNGTSVNGVLLEAEHHLVSGDVVGVGEVTLVFHDERRKTRPRRFLAPGQLFERLEEESDRALRHDRPLATIACALPADRPGHAALAAALAGVIGPSDVTGWTEDELLVILAPEVGVARGAEMAAAIHRALSSGGEVRVGIAQVPGDGCDAATLISAARAATAVAAGPEVVSAGAATREIALGERSSATSGDPRRRAAGTGHYVVIADPSMDRIYQLLQRIAPTDLPVLVSGETGVGKELAARAVHLWSARSHGPFIAVNCAAVPVTLFESQLFGHTKGAFSGAAEDQAGLLEAATGGTIFFDEIGELPLSAQAKLLRVLDQKRVTRLGETEERPLDLRVVAATNRDLDADVAAQRFRSDLLFRLNAAAVVLLPLRERRREIPVLARRFLSEASAPQAHQPLRIGDAAMRVLAEYRWPGNVRELKNAIEFAAAVAEEVVEPWHLPARLGATDACGSGQHETPPIADGPDEGARLRPIAEEIEALERRRMIEALELAGGVQTRAADLIGMPRRTFTTKLRKYGLR